MFPWNFAEAAFSRWAVKRVVKFLLKKKLGKFILGDIDLDQLDIQLRDGTIQLSISLSTLTISMTSLMLRCS
ncbi:hypothetical protein Bca52824_096357 [Brassica carinata]|uniref:Autophagy-related protein 2 n=1 Tax=Brassica carinata TaxID=52824 RepID=A0A8X7TH21_BRACI|nr:hypothetical protein Bca52824_096357 [Brassica carinata]